VSARLLAVSAVVASLGGLLAISWLIFVKQANETYWQWPGIVGLVATGLGFVGLTIGFALRDDDDPPRIDQRQKAGDKSQQIQIGGDVRINEKSE
jgi:hypothetical protein